MQMLGHWWEYLRGMELTDYFLGPRCRGSIVEVISCSRQGRPMTRNGWAHCGWRRSRKLAEIHTSNGDTLAARTCLVSAGGSTKTGLVLVVFFTLLL